MSEHEALTRFHDGCAARHRKAETRRLWRSRCLMRAQRSPLTNILINSGAAGRSPVAPGGACQTTTFTGATPLGHRPFLVCIFDPSAGASARTRPDDATQGRRNGAG
jgi:hypothetical protein